MSMSPLYIVGQLVASDNPSEVAQLEVRSRPYMHRMFFDAKAEAQRLAQKHPGSRFVVLRSVGFAEVEATRWVDCEEEIPF